MLYAALKLTHDGTIAVADEEKLLFSVELEKIHNYQRHMHFENLDVIDEVLEGFQLTIRDIDRWIIDGWEMDPDGETCSCQNVVAVGNSKISVNGYCNSIKGGDEKSRITGSCDKLGEYVSYTHVYDHICSTYCTSQFAREEKSAYILMYDGGVKPLLFYYDADCARFVFIKELMKLGGDVYTRMAAETEAFAYSRRKRNGEDTFTQKYAGRIMAYVALGEVRQELMRIFSEEYLKIGEDNSIENGWKQNKTFVKNVIKRIDNRFCDSDIIASFHFFIQDLLCKELRGYFNETPKNNGELNLCLCGGNFLNIKWNAAIRNLGIFSDIYAPPFINDTGVAIGAICAERLSTDKRPYLKCDTYSGNEIGSNYVEIGWDKRKCSVKELARYISDTKKPIVLLSGRCELGPRALGNRSIIADARSIQMKQLLNNIKHREQYRPIAPICLEEDAMNYFIPGSKDKFMLFEHVGTEYGLKAVPAVFHLDNTARLQTVCKEDNWILYELLTEYKAITGESVLCNTSANAPGRGFFPDVESAQRWGGADAIWSEGFLYTKILNV